jgi:hypothetical protein
MMMYNIIYCYIQFYVYVGYFTPTLFNRLTNYQHKYILYIVNNMATNFYVSGQDLTTIFSTNLNGSNNFALSTTNFNDGGGDIGRINKFAKVIPTDDTTYFNSYKNSNLFYYAGGVDLAPKFLPTYAEYTSGSGTITPPGWCAKLVIMLIGAGGGGGYGNQSGSIFTSGAGGGGGGWNNGVKTYHGGSYTYSVGSGGGGGTGPNALSGGGTGGSSIVTYDFTYTASGGTGGAPGTSHGTGGSGALTGANGGDGSSTSSGGSASGGGGGSGASVTHQNIQLVGYGNGGGGGAYSGGSFSAGSGGNGGYIRVYYLIN